MLLYNGTRFALYCRPWVVRTIFPYPKDVVFVIDNSVPMIEMTLEGKSYHSIAVEGVFAVLDTLNSRDRVGGNAGLHEVITIKYNL